MKTALVTGASSGLGEVLTRLLVRERGMRVAATGRRLDRLEALRASLPDGSLEILAGDIGDRTFRAELWAFAEERLGGVDLLINNAGIGHYSEFAEEDPDTIDAILAINVNALFDLTRLAARSMKERGRGTILQVSSVLGEFGMPYSATYNASKHAVNGLTKSLAYELRGTGVRARAALPGRFQSEFRYRSLGRAGGSPRAIGGEPTERVARGILRGMDGRRVLFAPTLTAAAPLAVARWARVPFDWGMATFGKRAFASLLDPNAADHG